MAPGETGLIDVHCEDGVLIAVLANDASRNALSTRMRMALGEVVRRAAQDDQVRALYLTAQGSSFCAGGDLNLMRETASDPWSVYGRFQGLSDWLIPLTQLSKPVVIGLNGMAVGGGIGLALCGDVIVAARSASFRFGFFRLGVIPDLGVMYHLPRLIGMARARNLMFSDSTLSAPDAHAMGLVAQVVEDARLYEAGLAEARRLASGPIHAIGLAKSLLARTFESGLHEMYAYEGLGQALAMAGDEFKEGLTALLDRRPAVFDPLSRDASRAANRGDAHGE